MNFVNAFKERQAVKRFTVDSIAHMLFYGTIGGAIAIALGIEFEVFVTMSAIGTVIQFLGGGIFGRFLDSFRKFTNA